MTLLPKVKLKAAVNFPASVLDGTGIDVTKANGSYRFDLDYGDFAPPVSALNDPTNQNALLWNSATNHYDLIPVSVLTGSGVFPATAFPLIESGSGAVGASTKYAREDHVHPTSNTFLQAGTGAVSRTLQDKARDIISVKDFGAVGNVTTIAPSDGSTIAITSGSPTLVVSAASFTSADIGKMIAVPCAGAAGASLRTTIAGWTSSSTVTLAANASTTVNFTFALADGDVLYRNIVPLGSLITITAGTNILVVAGANFVVGDVGKAITVPGAGTAGANLVTTVAGRTNATTITLGTNAITSVNKTYSTGGLAKQVCYGTDDTTALNAAFATGKALYVPPGIYAHTGCLINISSTRVEADSEFLSVLMCFQNNAAVITMANLVGSVELVNLGIGRAGAPIAGGNGVVFAGYVDNCLVSRLRVRNQYVGGVFSGTGYSRLEDCDITESLSHNYYFSNPASGPGYQTLQWQVIGNYSAAAGGSGYIVATVAGPPGIAMGEWINNASFGNTGYDLAFIGLPGCPINAVRITGGFVGGSGNSGLLLDTYAGLHRILNLYAEYAGTGTTGPGLTTPASGIGSGFEISATNTDVILVNPSATHNSQDGIRNSASASCTIVGGRMSSNTLYGARLNDGAKATITGMAFDLNTSGPLLATTNPNSLAVLNCLPATVDRLVLPAWTAYTPVQSGAATGTPSAASAYQVLGKTLALSIRFTATGAGSVTLSLPSGFAAAATVIQCLTGRENGVSGKMLVGTIAASGTTISVSLYDASASGAAAGAILDLSGTIQIA